MKIKKFLLVLCIILVFIGISTTVNAIKIEKLDDTSVVIHKNKSIVTTHITAEDSQSDSKMKKDLNKINKIVVKIDGKTVNTIKKGKGWKKYESFNRGSPEIIDRTTIMKKNLKGKKLGIYLYNSKNNLIKSKISTIKPKNIAKVKVTKKQAMEITNEIEQADKYPMEIANAVLKKGRFNIPFYWKVTIKEPGNPTWSKDIYIEAIDGDTFNPIVELV